MKIGYPCINRSLGCRGNRSFRLASYSEGRMEEAISGNLDCLRRMLDFNRENNILFFRVTSDIIPFASHPVCKFPWQEEYRQPFLQIGDFIKENRMRISMHPDQFTLINSIREDVYQRSIIELAYHCQVLDLMGLDSKAKVQIHVGGVYQDKISSIQRFVRRYRDLDDLIRRRLVIENDDRLFMLADCLEIHRLTGIPVLFDVFHHRLNNQGEEIPDCLEHSARTWGGKDGLLMVDYSSPRSGARPGSHAEKIDMDDFTAFIEESNPIDFDLMLEIKDKEISAIKAANYLKTDSRFFAG
jgi:UV DNA damage endonuclease